MTAEELSEQAEKIQLCVKVLKIYGRLVIVEGHLNKQRRHSYTMKQRRGTALKGTVSNIVALLGETTALAEEIATVTEETSRRKAAINKLSHQSKRK